MKVIIENPALFIRRIERFIQKAEQVLNGRYISLWNEFTVCKGKSKRVSVTNAKKKFRMRFINRFHYALECIESGDYSTINWIDFRDVICACGYKANFTFQGLTEKQLNNWQEDIIIEVYGKEDSLFQNTLDRLSMRL